MAGIVWIASFPKSGNTWVRAFLHNLLTHAGGGAEAPADINALGRFTTSEALTEHYRPLDPRPPSAWARADVARLRPLVHAALARGAADRVFVKTHCALATDHGQPTVNQAVTAAAVYLVRDPRDVAVSFARHIGASIDHAIAIMGFAGAFTDTGERYVSEPRGAWSENVASWTANPHPALHVMRYEDLLAEPVARFTDLARFLGIDAAAAAIVAAVEHSSFAVLEAQERRHGFRERGAGTFFRHGRAGAWRETLSDAQARAIVERHGAEMKRFGYGPPDS